MSQSSLLAANESTFRAYRHTLWNEISGTLVLSVSPDGWSDEFTIARHETFVGTFRQYSEQTLHFLKDARDYLYQIKESQGINAEVTYKVERIDQDWSFETIFEGVVLVHSLKFTDINAECQVEDINGLSVFHRRKNVEIDVFGEKTLDGVDYSSLNQQLTLPEQEFYLLAEWESRESLAAGGLYFNEILPITLTGNEYEDDTNVDTDSVAQTPSTAATPDSKTGSFFYNEINGTLYNGTLEGTIRLDYDYDNEIFELYLRTYNSGTNAQLTSVQVSLIETSEGVYGFSQDFTLNQNEHASLIYVYERIGVDPVEGLSFVKNNLPTVVKVRGIGETYQQIIVRGVNIKTAFERLTYMTSGLSFDSTYLDTIPISLTDGKNIRGKRGKVALSIDKLFRSLNTVYPVGLGYENDKIVVENLDYFFEDTVGKDISDRVASGDIQTEYLTDFFNQISFGFSKSVSEFKNGLGEFNSKCEYSSSVKFDKNKSVLSSYRGDTIGMTKLRAKPLLRYPGEDVNGDDDIFMVRTVVDGLSWKAKTNEGYDLAPLGWYNLDFAPARAIRRHRLLEYIPINSELRLEKREKDTSLVSQETGETAIDEQSNIPASDFPTRLFKPEKITVNTWMTRAEVDAIDTRKKIKLSDDLSGWILKLTKNYKNENVELELLRSWS